MNCEVCGKSEATVLYTHIAENEKKSVCMCATCVDALKARKRGAPAPEAPQAPAQTKVEKELSELEQQSGHGLCCERCSTTYEDFRKRGRFGCSDCYDTFAPELERLLKRIHGSLEHCGKGLVARAAAGAPSADMDELRRALDQAVCAEAYEQAAELRDRIRDLEEAGQGSRDVDTETVAGSDS
jgi:protein arginine kinase activator